MYSRRPQLFLPMHHWGFANGLCSNVNLILIDTSDEQADLQLPNDHGKHHPTVDVSLEIDTVVHVGLITRLELVCRFF